MRKAVFNTFNFAPPFLGPSLSQVQSCIDAGDEVHYITCLKSFKSCGFNTYGLKYMCDICEYRFNEAAGSLRGEYKLERLSDLFLESDFLESDQFMSTVKEVNGTVFYENFDAGQSALSSYISKTRDRDLELPTHKKLLHQLCRQAVAVYLAIKRFLKEKSIEQLVLFNGRWDYYRAAFRAASAVGIPCLIYENLRSGGYLELYEDSLPHIIVKKQQKFDDLWAQSTDLGEKKRLAREFFERKRNGEVIVDKAYSRNQQRTLLPEGIDLDKRLLVLYNSSEDEIAAIRGGEYKSPFFLDQAEGILFLADLVGQELPEYNLIIRMHPNLAGVNFGYVKVVHDLKSKYPNVLVVDPESKVDSYALMDAAYKVITFGSRIGIEANYWRKPVILLSKSFYFHSDVAYIPDHKDNIRALLTNDLAPKPIENSEKIGFYFMRGGEKATYYDYVYGKQYFFKDFRIDHLPFFRKNYYRLLKRLRVKNF